MFQTLEIFRLSGAMAAHAGQRQALTAVNVANADTPGFRASRLGGFAESLGAGDLRATRPGHRAAARPADSGGEAAPNGNTVSLESEMLESVDAAREHARALAIYRHGLTVLRLSLGR